MNSRAYPRDRQVEALARGLGWFSLALGAAELLAPERVAAVIGVRPQRRTLNLLRAYGAREIAAGLAIFAAPRAAAPLWSRVAGDAVDTATLLGWSADADSDRQRLGVATAAVAGVGVLDLVCARQLQDQAAGAPPVSRRVHVERVTTLNRSVEDVYRYWADFRNFPRFMRHVESVELLGGNRSHWRVSAPAGMTVQWDAEIVEQRDSELIAWRTLPNADVEHSGTVRFTPAPGARGTEVRVALDFAPPAGRLGRSIAWLFRKDPDQQLHEDLRRFKQLVESGEIPLSEGFMLWRPGQPVANPEDVRSLAGVRS